MLHVTLIFSYILNPVSLEGTTGYNKNKVFIGKKGKKEMRQVKSVQVTKDPQVAGLGLQLACSN